MNTPRPTPGWEAPPGTVHAPMVADKWRLVAREKRCRRQAAGESGCKTPAVAELNRSRRDGENWWAYCPDHMYGRWIEDGRVLQWRVVPVESAAVSAGRVRALIAALESDIAWQRQMYGNSEDPAEKSAIGRLIGMEDALRIVREHLTPTPAATKEPR
jgi:hypothetical protein